MYENKVVLAPMVKIGTLPFRLLCLDYGADLVYSEEIIERKLLYSKRTVNEKLGTIDYISERDGKIVYQTCKLEKGKNILQIGTASPELALKTALHMYEDYAGFDINMGCPKQFSTHGGMGSELLKDPQKIKEILTTLTKNIDKPVTCKIRLLKEEKDTIDLVKMIESCGVKAIGVHARYVPQRPREKAHLDLLPNIVNAVSIPIIANGDVFTHSDIEKNKKVTGASSIMIARGALWNASIFQKNMESQEEVALKYLKICNDFDVEFSYAKFTLTKMFEIEDTKTFQDLVKSKNYQDLLKSIPKPL